VASKIEGAVVAISDGGNLITDITAAQLRDAPRGDSVTVSCDEHETIGIYDASHNEPPMTLIALLTESGKLELAIVGDSAKIMLGVRVGEKVVVKW
jgi:S-adenosylmethionine hydrolase